MENCTTVFSMLSSVCKYPLKMRMDSHGVAPAKTDTVNL